MLPQRLLMRCYISFMRGKGFRLPRTLLTMQLEKPEDMCYHENKKAGREAVPVTEEEKRQKKFLEKIKGFRLMDDEFMTKCFEDAPECVELVLRIILGKPDLKVIEAHTQVFVVNLLKRSVRLDVFALEGTGRRCNVEIQRESKGAGFKRARFHSSAIDMKVLPKSGEFDDLPETYVIFITENDVMGKGLPLYTVDRYVKETGELFDDEAHIIYVNGAYRDDTDLGKLMHDFSCCNPDDMNFSLLADRTRFFKEEQEGIEIMSKVMEEIVREAVEQALEKGIEQGRGEGIEQGIEQGIGIATKKIVCNMIKLGQLTLSSIAEMTGLTLEEVEKIKIEQPT